MGKRVQRREVLKYETIGLAMLTGSALALGKLGLVGRYVDVAFIYLAGSWSFLLPIFIGYAALFMMVKRTSFVWNHRHIGLLILFLTWLTGMEFFFFQSYAASLPPDSTVPLYSATLHALQSLRVYVLTGSLDGTTVPAAGGGLIGYACFSVLHYLFSTLGTLLILGIAVLLGAALTTEKSLVKGVQRGTRWMEKRLDNLWKGSRQFANVLLEKDTDTEPATLETPPSNEKKSRRRPQLIIDGEIFEAGSTDKNSEAGFEKNAGSEEKHSIQRPIVRDFAAQVREKAVEAAESKASDGLISPLPPAHLQKSQRSASQGGASAGLSGRTPVVEEEFPYTVGVPVHDENYRLPPLHLFTLPQSPKSGFNQQSAHENARKLEATLESFGVHAKVLEISRGPTVTRYELQPAAGVKVSKIVGLTDDIALALAASGIRMEAPVPGKSVIGIEIPNQEIAVVTLREVLESEEFQKHESKLAIALGRDIAGNAIIGNLQKMPHLLVAGATGSGKSVCINGMIASLLVRAKPHEVKFMMIDPKMVELNGYNGIPHLLAPVVTDPRKAAFALKKVVQEMENRYKLFADRGARDIERYNQLLQEEGLDALPYIVVIVDELADLMMVAPGDVEDAICRIAQMARAAGIHLIVATQRPSVDVITGVIKANIPSRIAFAVSSMADSRTILDSGGAEKLLGRGDMLYWPVGAPKSTRVQGAFVSEGEIERLVEYVKEQQNAVYTVDLQIPEESEEAVTDAPLDPLFVDAMDLVVDNGHASVSMIQRRFRVGYSRAARIVDQMEQQGFVGRFEGSKPRDLLISKLQWEEMKNSNFLRSVHKSENP
ncbi:FtsK/SpoIIIE family DNA translocase [Alicyclobacillus tolerans]|uniref:DNA translocase FtsK n=1 Tax=Alicyclobacillus tolerans TaxID=90970 RepID=A0A1M6RHL5_9BACL|nr:DNA translocase FtsK [Alicyclobacillus montanus]SHK31896.1 DNA translocase FtsK [Alicyclobacillus montanus]